MMNKNKLDFYPCKPQFYFVKVRVSMVVNRSFEDYPKNITLLYVNVSILVKFSQRPVFLP